MDQKNGLYRCNICNKPYSCYKSLWNHNKKFHNDCQPNVNPMSTQCQPNVNPLLTNIKCNYCNKIFNTRQGKCKHQKKCKNKININENNSEIIKLNQIKEEKEKLKVEEKLLKLKIKLQNIEKLDTKTFKSLNRMLMIKSYMKNSNNTNINNTQNINLIGFNKEDILEVLTNTEKRKVINSGYSCLDELINNKL